MPFLSSLFAPKREERRPRRRRRPEPEPITPDTKPQTVEELRRARTDYLDRTPEQRRLEWERSKSDDLQRNDNRRRDENRKRRDTPRKGRQDRDPDVYVYADRSMLEPERDRRPRRQNGTRETSRDRRYTRTAEIRPKERPELRRSRTSNSRPVRNVSPRTFPIRTKSEPVPQLIECSICTDETNTSQVCRFKCSHDWCHTCLRRAFFFSDDGAVLANTPKCCNEPLPPSVVTDVLTPREAAQWTRRMREAAEKRPLYCASPECDNRWISPRHFFEDHRGRRFAECAKCRARVCLRCRMAFHGSRPCPVNEATRAVLKMAKEEGLVRCHQCRMLVEKTEGCNHMTCICGAQFCYKCSTPYKSGEKRCECELFDHSDSDSDDDGPLLFDPQLLPFLFLEEQIRRHVERFLAS